MNMKKLSIGAALLVSALVVGCQDSNNDPISSNFSTAHRSMSKKTDNPDGIIAIDQVVSRGEAEVADAYELSATLQYTLTSTGFDGVYSLSTVFGGTMLSLADGKTTGRADGEAIEDVVIPEKTSVEITKSYTVKELEQTIRLYITLDVAADKIEFRRAWIEDDPKGGFSSKK